MSRNTQIKITCDCCGKECVPFTGEEIVLKYYMADPSFVLRVNYQASIPYGLSHADICRECVEKAMRKHYEIAPKKN